MGQMIAIVGRPNVGKSTLFNRLTQSRTAIVDDTAGTTRDRQYGRVDWNGKEFSIVDTGGWVVNSEDVFESEINKQVELAIEQADEILFVVDAMNGVTDLDDHVAEILRKSRKPVILVANKVDSNDWLYNVAEFYSLGLGDPYPVSAVSGFGTGDLLDEVVRKLPEKPADEDEKLDDIPKFAIVGRPNAGKSSLINAFIGEDRHIVTDIAGTTRDSIYTRYNKFGFDFYLVDTAGIRKKNKVQEDIEYYSVIRSIRSIEASDVCILMIDATPGGEALGWATSGTLRPTRVSRPYAISRRRYASVSRRSPIFPFSSLRPSPSSASSRCLRQPWRSTKTVTVWCRRRSSTPSCSKP